MTIQNRVHLFKRRVRVLLSLALVGCICSAPLMAQSSKRSNRSSKSSSQSSASRNSAQRFSNQSSRPQSFSRTSSSQSQPKSSSTSKRPSRSTQPSFKRVPKQSSPKKFGSSSRQPQKSFKIAPKMTRPAFKVPQSGKRPTVKGNTKDIKLNIPSRKIPDRKLGNNKFVPKPGTNVVRPRPGKNNNEFKPGKGSQRPSIKGTTKDLKPRLPGQRIPDRKVGNSKVVPRPGKKVVRPRPGNNNNVFKPGKNIRVPGFVNNSKGKGFSKGKGRPFTKVPPSKKWLGKNGVPISKDLFKGKNVKPINKSLAQQLKSGKLNSLINGKTSKKWNLKKQFNLHKKGDIARQLNLNHKLLKNGGWRNRTLFGQMSKSFTTNHFGAWYAGPGCYPSYCWSPHWSAWVDWCWWDWCHPVCDPRPLICRPVFCSPCVAWDWYECPVWQPLPVVTCGTWVDVDPFIVDSGLDLQMLAVRFVDSGHPEEQLGPRFRVWFRNNSNVDINVPFNVMLLASNSRELTEGLPEAGSRIDNIAAGQVQSVDIRLPFAASTMSSDTEGNEVPFEQLHVLIDSHREIPETFKENNGAIMPRVDVLAVDPALFSTDTEVVLSGSLINLAGEGLGPEPGKVLVSLNGMNFEAEIHGWYDLGVRVKMPELPLLDSAEATLVVIRGDGAASNPIEVQFAPQMAAIFTE